MNACPVSLNDGVQQAQPVDEPVEASRERQGLHQVTSHTQVFGLPQELAGLFVNDASVDGVAWHDGAAHLLVGLRLRRSLEFEEGTVVLEIVTRRVCGRNWR